METATGTFYTTRTTAEKTPIFDITGKEADITAGRAEPGRPTLDLEFRLRQAKLCPVKLRYESEAHPPADREHHQDKGGIGVVHIRTLPRRFRQNWGDTSFGIRGHLSGLLADTQWKFPELAPHMAHLAPRATSSRATLPHRMVRT